MIEFIQDRGSGKYWIVRDEKIIEKILCDEYLYDIHIHQNI